MLDNNFVNVKSKIKEIVHTKMKMLLSVTHSRVVLNLNGTVIRGILNKEIL